MQIILFLASLLLTQNILAHDGAVNWQMGLQKAVTPVMEELHKFHNFLLIICFAIVILVIALIAYVYIKFHESRNKVPAKFSHNILIEVIWTVIPVIILIIIAIPSFRILAFIEKTPQAELTVKVVGYQWYWHYIYPDNGNFEFDSYLITDDKLAAGDQRLFEVDNRMVVPENTVIKFLITAGDVIHSFALPALGIKTDAVPGRVNETWAKITQKGTYYGQCSELCGVNHGFMPIALDVVSKEEFNAWVENAKQKFAENNSVDKTLHAQHLPKVSMRKNIMLINNAR
jgi:cytochrome c oxidase subunit II